jgi:hypothetical protein
MKRRVLNFLTGLSLLLCGACVALWVRSYWVSDAVLWATSSAEYGAQSISGTFALVESNLPERPGLWWDRYNSALTSPWETGSPLSLPNRLGFGYRSRILPTANIGLWGGTSVVVPPIVLSRMVLFPLWLPALLFALPPGRRLYHRLRPRYGVGLCPACGYDLRATPGRCPECGKGNPVPHP